MHLDYPTRFYRTVFPIDLFSMYVFFPVRPRDGIPQRTDSFKCRLMHLHPHACARIINEKNKRQIPWRTSRGLIWENKTYQLKRFISPGHYRSQDGGLSADKQGALSGLGETVNSHRIPVSKVFKLLLYTNIFF